MEESELSWILVAQEEEQTDMRGSEVGRKGQREVGSADSWNVPSFQLCHLCEAAQQRSHLL